MRDQKPDFFSWLGYREYPDFRVSRGLGAIIGVLLGLICIWILAIAIGAMWQASLIVWNGSSEQSQNPHGLGFVIAAIVGAPFVIWRALVAQKQADTESASLANEKLNDAFNALAARHTVPRSVRQILYRMPGDSERKKPRAALEIENQRLNLPEMAHIVKRGDWETRDVEVPDILIRSVAIDRLSDLSEEYPSQSDRIASVLHTYFRETSIAENPPEELPADLEGFAGEIHIWARELNATRRDREMAIELLVRMSETRENHEVIGNFQLCNLQGLKLDRLFLKRANFAQSNLEGCAFVDPSLANANFSRAKMSGAMFIGTSNGGQTLQASRFHMAHFEDGTCSQLDMQAAKFQGTKLARTSFHACKLQGAFFGAGAMAETRFNYSDLTGAATMAASADEARCLEPHYHSIFADWRTGRFVDNPPAHWASEELNGFEFHRRWRAWQDTLPDFPEEWRER